MGLITKTVKIKWNSRTKKHYEELGYIYTKMGDEFEVKVEDLTKGSEAKVECKCDGCDECLIWTYKNYNKCVKDKRRTYCNKCASRIIVSKKLQKIKTTKTFEQWCIENNREDLLLRWDYELNKCKPSEVSFRSSIPRWFKCLLHPEHESELKGLNNIIENNSAKCNKCNSIAQYILDNFPNKKLEEVWDYEKNGDLDPWGINKGTDRKIWIICQEKDYHGSYETTPDVFSRNIRCSFCAGKKVVHPLDSLGQYVIDNYGEEFLWDIWSDKNGISPFETSIHSNKKVWWNCPDNKHEPFERSCNESERYEFRCSKCSEERKVSTIEEKVKAYLEELGYKVLTEHNCTIRPINPKTKNPLPFDNEIILENGKHLIIEVHGKQHYKIDGLYIKTKEDLHQRKLYDRYKRIKCIQAGYEYLEIPHTTFDKKETYKLVIKEKVKEILSKI